MTGQYAHNHGVRNNKDAPSLRHATTIQRHLWDAGYKTGIVGKYLNEWPIEAGPPYFEDYSLFSRGYTNTRWNLNGKMRTIKDYSTNFIENRAIRFIRRSERNDDTPWYLYMTPYAPHLVIRRRTRLRQCQGRAFPSEPGHEGTGLHRQAGLGRLRNELASGQADTHPDAAHPPVGRRPRRSSKGGPPFPSIAEKTCMRASNGKPTQSSRSWTTTRQRGEVCRA